LEALALLHELEVPPAVILLDLMMPIMDGYGFLEELRKDASLPSIPVAVITAGYGVDRSRLDLSTPIVAKPIDIPRLIRTIGGLFGAAEAHP
jgi:CheY-like chemotaxis protein